MSLENAKRTPLFTAYKDSGKIVDFAGWALPVTFKGVNAEHLAVREAAGMFDTSHMGEVRVKGPDAFAYAQKIFCNDLSKIPNGKAQYGELLNPNAGIIDDLIAYRMSETEIFFCVNAANADKDFKWMKSQKAGEKIEIINQSEAYAQIAVQGPKAAAILNKLLPGISDKVGTFFFAQETLLGEKSIIARTGYTGEDGFEIFYPAGSAVKLWNGLLEAGKPEGLEPCGLGARDTLRLEMGYPLHGHDISEDTTPLEAGLGWTLGWNKNFIGKEKLEQQKAAGVTKKRVGMEMIDRGIARDGYPVKAEGKVIGKVTSGTKTPCLDKAIAVAYVETRFAGLGQELFVEIRSEDKKAVVVKMPFYKKAK
jgi:aminomethyltransferase